MQIFVCFRGLCFGLTDKSFLVSRLGPKLELIRIRNKKNQANSSETNWDQLRPRQSKSVQVSPHESNWDQMRPIESRWVRMNPNGYEGVLSPRESRWDKLDQVWQSQSRWNQMTQKESTWIHMRPNETSVTQFSPPALLAYDTNNLSTHVCVPLQDSRLLVQWSTKYQNAKWQEQHDGKHEAHDFL